MSKNTEKINTNTSDLDLKTSDEFVQCFIDEEKTVIEALSKAKEQIAKEQRAKERRAKEQIAKERRAKERSAKERRAKDPSAKERREKDRIPNPASRVLVRGSNPGPGPPHSGV